ncbi:VPLPA-CTERM sorting domain-containing protein [Roseisalinus antarcticus]|uniref:PEP-CTERM protein-sorting domain-containing protein n=1 Tax=Roseisalinus antarcticus TaxID=254357 RepID=A0A1Y5T9V6_9RHOB|nr:VPLPA-CTERM sorting domain-containing protein [Roseisalinus antarcticus]SLN58653.1 hypothetical protein ROA7023_02700 [Roseisalinus antarcticus]
MIKTAKALCAAAAVSLYAGLAAPAAALPTITVTDTTAGASASGTGLAQTFTFAWGPGAASEWVDFSISSSTRYSLTLTSYTPTSGTAGYIFFVPDTSGPVGARLNDLSTETGACSGAAAEIAGNCNFFGVDPGSLSVPVAEVGDSPINDILPASYRLGVYKSLAPSGSASFTISTVPLPAGALLLLTGLGAFALALRRQAA